MKPLLFFIFIVLSNLCFAQGEVILNKISGSDSLNLLRSMGTMIKAIENKDDKMIRSSCMETVQCEICMEKISFDHPPQDGFVAAGAFSVFLVDWLRTSPAWIDIKQYAPVMSSTSGKGYVPKSVKLKPDEYFTEFELSYPIESSSNKCIFSFVKDEEIFKLWSIRFSP